jgi:hypothetical protein
LKALRAGVEFALTLYVQPLRWTATGLLEAEKKFRRIKGYQEILLLKERLNPSPAFRRRKSGQ